MNINDLRDYKPSENPNPNQIPDGYHACKYLGKKEENPLLIIASVDHGGEIISCHANCPYGNQSDLIVNLEADGKEEQRAHLCNTKGLVHKSQLQRETVQ